jgi:hypothetical protein
MFLGGLSVLLGLGSVLLALGMVIPAVSLGGCTMRFCRGLVMFRRFVVCIFHVDFSCWPTNCGGPQKRPQKWLNEVPMLF